jgi:hypothetical protein
MGRESAFKVATKTVDSLFNKGFLQTGEPATGGRVSRPVTITAAGLAAITKADAHGETEKHAE